MTIMPLPRSNRGRGIDLTAAFRRGQVLRGAMKDAMRG